MASSYRAHILAQIRTGRRSWSVAELFDDSNAFRTQIVEPLRQLKYEGVVQALSETELHRDNGSNIIRVTIIGAVADPAAADAV
jgi:hypothetical protein